MIGASKRPINRYAKGRRLEYAWKKKLEAEGSLVFRTAGSHGAADLVELSPRPRVGEMRVRLIQCKAGTPTKADREKLRAMKAKWGHQWLLATKEGLEGI